eukprot:g7544.t1
MLSGADLRREKRKMKSAGGGLLSLSGRPSSLDHSGGVGAAEASDEARAVRSLTENEDQLLEFVAKVNQVYQERLGKPAPFMTFLLVGQQSAGKSTIVERFLKSVINVVKEGTGTRCPLDITCIHDAACEEPVCELSGHELELAIDGVNRVGDSKKLSVSDVFRSVTAHNEKLAAANKFSRESLFLIVRSRHVQNMRFVDLPGIISNRSNGIDNREDIKEILKAEIRKPNTRMCVLLEPMEFAKNPIVDFIDNTLASVGGRSAWVDKTTFFMTKFDMKVGDSRTGSKANAFFQEFKENDVVPHCVITPTLATEKLDADEMFRQRQDLLLRADREEAAQFREWLSLHQSFLDTHPGDELLERCYAEKIGFPCGQRTMRAEMLEDTVRRLPEVVAEIKKELKRCEQESRRLKEQEKYNDPAQLQLVVVQLVQTLQQRIFTYLDGCLEIAIKFPEKLQTLEDELDEEDSSDWASRELNHFTESEDEWRDHIADLEGDYPTQVQAECPFLGGKQYQRAVQFFRANMIDRMPEPHNLKKYVPMATGYLQGGLQRENWERAIVEIIKHCVKKVAHPGINFFVKHVGSIFRRLFALALDDVKTGEQFSATFSLLPVSVEKFLHSEFDSMLWKLMVDATEKTHCSLEPMYTTVNPNLPTFVSSTVAARTLKLNGSRQVTSHENVRLLEEDGFFDSLRKKACALVSGSGEQAKKILRDENQERAQTKKEFLSDERTAMITGEETTLILQRSFEYIAALMEFNLVTLEFQFNHYLYQGFKDALQREFGGGKLVVESDFSKLVQPDAAAQERVGELEMQIEGLREALGVVVKMQTKLR